MRVLHVVPTYLPATRYGGPIYSVHGLCSALTRRGHSVEVFTTNVDGSGVSDVPLGQPVARDGVEVTYFPTGFGRRLYRSPAMGRALAQRTSKFDIVHLHSVFLWPTSAAAAAARRSQVPFVLAPRGMLVPELIAAKSSLIKMASIELFERRNVATAAAVHVTTNLEARDLARLGLKASKIEVIPNGFDIPPEESGASIIRHLPRPVIVSLGRLSWKKGIERLIVAASHVPGASIVIAGNDEENYLPRLREAALNAGVADRVHFIGPVHGKDKWRLLADADVFALPSFSENFGIVVLEAMAMGVPVVVTPAVGLAADIAAAEAGIITEGDPQTLGASLRLLLENRKLRERMGRNGRAAAAARFSWDSIAGRCEQVYLDIVQAPQRTQAEVV